MKPKPTEVLLFTLLVGVLAACSPGVAAQDSDERAEGALFLLLPVGAQGVGLARAMTWAEGSEGAFWNPAGLTGARRSQGVLFRSDHVAGTATAVSGLWVTESVGTLGVSYLLLDAGEIDQTDEFGNYIGTITIRNHLGVVSGATRITDTFAVGLNLKVVRFQLSCRGICSDEGTTATTYAIDAGVQATPIERLRVGAMVAHLGPSLQVVNAEQADPLPTRVRVSAAYNVVAAITDSENLRGWLAFEVEDHLRSFGNRSYYLGTELTAGQTDALSLRAGHV